MRTRYEKFYKEDWGKAYGFWHKVITRGEYQVRILKDILSNFNTSTVNILDLGCGKGDEIREAIKDIKDKKIRIVANDTSKEALNEYSKINSDNTVETVLLRLEDLPGKVNKKFDLILFSHCLYDVDLPDLFTKYYKLLNDEGAILIFLDSNESGIKKIQLKFWDEVHGISFDENTAEDIVKELENEKIRHKIMKFSNYMDLNKLAKINQKGVVELLIPFTFRTHEIKKEILDKIVLYIIEIAHDNKIDNKTFAMIIRK